MDLYQAGYFRLGKQGRGSGWDIVAPSDGMSNFAIKGFKGIATSLIKLEETMRLPVEVAGLFQYDKFIYFIHVNYAASGEDNRGVAYVHGYCFNLKDYYELCIQPEMLFGIRPGTFDMEYKPGITAYPVEHSFSYERINYYGIMDKYHISNEQYRKLVLGVICAIEGYSNPMCIKCSTSLDNYLEVYKDVMYLVMSGLPYHLRQKVLSFSYKGIQTTVYFSDVTEGNNYFDLDNGEAFCDFSMLGKYYFTQIYNTPAYYNNEERDRAFQNIASFINASYKNPLKNADCGMIEAGFQEKIKKNEEGGIPPEIVPGLLEAFLRYDITNSDEAAGYIAGLLGIAYNNNLEVIKSIPIEKIKELFEKFTLENLHWQIALVYSEMLSGCERDGRKEKGFSVLWDLKKEKPVLYDLVCTCLKELNMKLYADYYINRFLPSEIVNLDKAEEFLINNKKSLFGNVYKAFLKQVKKIIDKEMEKADSFENLLDVVIKVNEIKNNFRELIELKDILDYSCFVLWNNFDIKWFNIEDLDNYQFCQVRKMAYGFEKKLCPNAESVNWLASMAGDVLKYLEITKLYEFVFTDDKFKDKELKKNVLQELKEKFFNGRKSKVNDIYRDMDISLLLIYDIKKEQFAMVNWIAGLSRCREIELYGSLMEQFVQESFLLQKEEIKELIVKSIEDILKNKKVSKYNNLNSSGREALNVLQNCLSGKEAGSEDTGQLFIYTMHRVVIGFFALFAFITCNLSLLRYGSKGSYIPLVLAAILIVSLFTLASYILRKNGNDIAALTGSSMGIKNGNNILLYMYIGIGILLMLVVMFIWLIDEFLLKAICSMIFLIVAAASVFLYGITFKE